MNRLSHGDLRMRWLGFCIAVTVANTLIWTTLTAANNPAFNGVSDCLRTCGESQNFMALMLALGALAGIGTCYLVFYIICIVTGREWEWSEPDEDEAVIRL